MVTKILNIDLRRATATDAEIMTHWRDQESSRRFQASPHRTVDQIRELLRQQDVVLLSSQSIGRFHWIAELDGIPVAQIQIAVDDRDRTQNSATLGYMVDDRYQGRGVATASVRAALPIAFDPEGLAVERLEAVAAVANSASRRVLEKTGFQFEGIQRGLLVIRGERVDHACYAMLHTDSVAEMSK